jgi:hypothetical protein
MKPMGTVVAVGALLAVLLAPAIAQKPQSEPPRGPDEERMARMMTMMEQMEEQMTQMHEQMKGMHGIGPMQGRMGRMMGMMGRMTSMMEEHRDEVRTMCHGGRHDRR